MQDLDSKTFRVEDLMQAIDDMVPEVEGPTEVAAPSLRTDEVFDKDAFMARMLGDTELAREVAGLFLNYSPDLVAAIDEALQKSDAIAFTRALHSLKAAVANIDAKAILHTIIDLENLGQRNNMARAVEIFPTLEAQIDRLHGALAEIGERTHPSRILVADDDPITRRMLQATLIKWGHEAVVCVDGTQALEALKQPDSPNLAILDWMMPGMDGIEVCRQLRQLGRPDRVYVILLTAKDRTHDIIAGLDAGADDYLTKPFDPKELKVRLREGFRALDLTAGGGEAASEAKFEGAHDPLTGLLNREGILVSLKREIVRSQRENRSFGVILAESSSVGEINQAHGEGWADTALREIAQRIGSTLRPHDHAGRYGLHRFLIVLPDCDRPTAMKLTDLLRTDMGSAVVRVQSQSMPIRVNLGVALALEPQLVDLESVMAAAEAALQEARKRGPNEAASARVAPGKPVAPAPAVVAEKPPKTIPKATKLDLEMIVAARTGNLPRVRSLLDTGAHVNAQDNKGNTALIESAFFKYPDMVKLLLERGADVTIRNSSQDTALTEAIRAGHSEVVKLLVLKLPRVGLKKEDLVIIYRALMEASSYGKTEVVRIVKTYLARFKPVEARNT